MRKLFQLLSCFVLLWGFCIPYEIQAASTPGSYPSRSQLVSNQVSRSFPMYDAGYYGMENPLTVPDNEFAVSKFFVDQQTGYCVQPDMAYYEGAVYTDKLTGNDAYQALKKNYKGLGYSDAQIARMQQITSVGYGYNGDTSNDLYAATQILMWKIKHPNDIQVSSPSIQAKMKEIEDRIQVFNKKVSFQNSTVTLKGYGKENALTLQDSSSVFQHYNFIGSVPKGLHIQKDKNKLVIWADKPYQQNVTLQFQSLYGNQGVNNALTVYTLNTSQTLATFGRITAPAMSVNVHVDIHASKGNLLITKSASQLDSVLFEEDGSVKEFVYAEKGLPNAQFDLQALEDIVDPLSEKVVYKKGDLVAKVTTDANGQSSVPDLYFGTYGLTETKVPAGFVLNDEMQIIEIKDEATFNKVIDQQAAIFDERQMLELKLKKVSSSDKKGIGSAVFELIADQDIADAAGNVLISQGQRIQTLTSNDKGNIRFSLDLPVAKYILKEIQAPAGHALMKEDISVDATALKEKEHTFVFEQELVNTFELLSLKIRKVDKESKEAIQDTFEFTLYEDKDCKKVIQSKTGKQGIVTFKDLNPGTYYLKETKAPQGYNGSQTVHTIQVTRQGVMYTNGDKNEKRELIVENEKKKEVIPAVAPHIFTGTHNGLIHYVFGALAMLGIMAWIVLHQKKQKKS